MSETGARETREWPAINLDGRPDLTVPADFCEDLGIGIGDSATVELYADHVRVYPGGER